MRINRPLLHLHLSGPCTHRRVHKNWLQLVTLTFAKDFSLVFLCESVMQERWYEIDCETDTLLVWEGVLALRERITDNPIVTLYKLNGHKSGQRLLETRRLSFAGALRAFYHFKVTFSGRLASEGYWSCAELIGETDNTRFYFHCPGTDYGAEMLRYVQCSHGKIQHLIITVDLNPARDCTEVQEKARKAQWLHMAESLKIHSTIVNSDHVTLRM